MGTGGRGFESRRRSKKIGDLQRVGVPLGPTASRQYCALQEEEKRQGTTPPRVTDRSAENGGVLLERNETFEIRCRSEIFARTIVYFEGASNLRSKLLFIFGESSCPRSILCPKCAFHWAKLKILTKSRTIKVIIGHLLTLSRTIQLGFGVKNQPRTIRLNIIMCVEVTRTIGFFPNLSFRSSRSDFPQTSNTHDARDDGA